MEVEITSRRAIRIWWSFTWRNAIATLVTIMISMVIGFFLGMVLALAHVAPLVIRLVAMPIGFVIGLIVSYLPLRMILGMDFGEFRLALVARETAEPPVLTQPSEPITVPPPLLPSDRPAPSGGPTEQPAVPALSANEGGRGSDSVG